MTKQHLFSGIRLLIDIKVTFYIQTLLWSSKIWFLMSASID